jgi:hypothetical protein
LSLPMFLYIIILCLFISMHIISFKLPTKLRFIWLSGYREEDF